MGQEKSKWYAFLILTTVLTTTVLVFQNCGEQVDLGDPTQKEASHDSNDDNNKGDTDNNNQTPFPPSDNGGDNGGGTGQVDCTASTALGSATHNYIVRMRKSENSGVYGPSFNSDNVLDETLESFYSSPVQPTAEAKDIWVAAWTNLGMLAPYVNTIVIGGRKSNDHFIGFPKKYYVKISGPDFNGWKNVGDVHTEQPNASGFVSIFLPEAQRINGVQIYPIELGPSSNDQYIFQIAHLGLRANQLKPCLLKNETRLDYSVRLFSAKTNSIYNDDWISQHVIDQDLASTYSSEIQPGPDGQSLSLALYSSGTNPYYVSHIVLRPRMKEDGVTPQAFPKKYRIYVTDPTNQNWIQVGGLHTQQPENGYVVVQLPNPMLTRGVQIVPIELGQDALGDYIFQLSDVDLRLSAGI